MNKVLLGLLLLVMGVFSTSCLYAEEAKQASCEDYERISKKIMQARLDGVAMSDMIRIDNTNETMKQIIIEAYETPRYHTADYQKRAVEDFGNKIFLECTKAKARSKK